MSEKQKLLNFISNFEENISSIDILNQILVYFKVQNALAAIENKQTISNDEMKELIKNADLD